jgi:hypothetical protein
LFKLRFAVGDIPKWSAGYSYDGSDARFLSEVRPAVRKRGYYPTLDYRALWSLGYSRPPHYTMPFWLGYVAYVRELSRRSGHRIRTVDRALWQYSKARQR